MDTREPVVVYTVKRYTNAEIIKNFLESEGIPCTIGGEGQIGLSGVLDIEILVPAANADEARRLLKEHERSQLAADEDAEDEFGEAEDEVSEE